jgi:AraC family transcriptional regulator of adaptative response / DNA-3-methyladenine glycosylase II
VELDPKTCYRALRARDARFDGRFFTAVRTTGVYCRPICPARTPKRENCMFLRCAAAAQEAGYRPCLRCRPESSPGTPAWLGTSATVSRALRLIADGALDNGSVDDLAGRLGVGERHLRRLFCEHLGASPLAVAKTQRLLFAKQLIDETRLPMSEIAFASGFSSIRRFNDAVRAAWKRPPRELRRAHQRGSDPGGAADDPALVLRLPYRPPFDWSALASFLALRAIPGVEQVSEERYSRSIEVDGVSGLVDVRPAAGKNYLVACLRLSGPAPLSRISQRLRRLFDLTADPTPIAAQLESDRVLRDRLRARPGLRVPGAWDGFELAVRAILGQQISVRGATTLAGRLVSVYGDKLPIARGPGGVLHAESADAPSHVFPRPQALVAIDAAAVGLTAARARAISALAAAVVDGSLDLDASRGLEESVTRLCELPGIGEWTAHYIAMRALREPDAFPASDLGLRHALGANGAPAPITAVRRRAESWRPWRAYAAVHLWADLAPAGSVSRKNQPTQTKKQRSRT